MEKFVSKKQMVIWLIVVLSLVSGCRSYDYIPDSYVPGNYLDHGAYSFDPEILLTSLDQEKNTAFTPLLATPEAFNPLPSGSFPWDQPDFLKIASALQQLIWNEAFVDGHLHRMSFKVACQDSPNGFDVARIVYFEIANSGNQESYVVHDLLITPLVKIVSWGEAHYYKTYNWESIDLTKLIITAGDALLMAEENGGKDARLAVENACSIGISLAPGSQYDGWSVRYSDKNASTIFHAIIDPYTGEYQILNREE